MQNMLYKMNIPIYFLIFIFILQVLLSHIGLRISLGLNITGP